MIDELQGRVAELMREKSDLEGRIGNDRPCSTCPEEGGVDREDAS
jgi:hypothetical protein